MVGLVNYKIPRDEWFPAQYTSLSHFKTVNAAVKKKLTCTQLQAFRKTVFGPYVDLNIIFSSGIVHEALLRQVEVGQEDCMTFNIRGNDVTFGKDQFMLVTGLWPDMNNVPRPASSINRLKDLNFPNVRGLTVFDLESK